MDTSTATAPASPEFRAAPHHDRRRLAPRRPRLPLLLGLAVSLALLILALAGAVWLLFFWPASAEAGLRSALLLAAQALLAGLALHALVGRLRNGSDRRWRALLAASGHGVAEWTRASRANRGIAGSIRCSPLWCEMSSQPGQEEGVSPTDWLASANVHPMDRDRAQAAVQAVLWPESGDSCHERLRLRGAQGDWRCHELRVQVSARNRQGQAVSLLQTLRDVSAQDQAEARERMSVALFQHLHDGLLVTDLQFRVLDANPAFCEMLGQPREALLGKPASALLPQTLRQAGHAPEQIQQALLAEEAWSGNVQLEHADRSVCTLALTVVAIQDPDGPPRHLVVTAQDLTQSQRQQAQLSRMARFDLLTGLPNQDEFARRLKLGIATSEREVLRLSVCRVDLDHFKRVNTEHGEAIGDELLRQVAIRLQGALRNAPTWSDTVARLSGDEFALLLRTADAEEAQRAIARLLNVLRAPYRLGPPGEELTLELSASIGATQYPQDYSDAETLMRHAAQALYQVKHAGRNGFRFFDAAKRLRDEASLLELARVQQALDHGELSLHYQPKIDMQAGHVLGMEALLRWQHPERGLLSPAEFLPLIEQTGLATQVGDWVIDQALKQSAQWLELGLRLQISVNVTARQLQMPDFAQRLQELINRHQLPVARYLCLEVLESAALADVSATHELIMRCRAFGVRFALDDFGTGYSTLTYLKKLPVDALKIDRSFVQNMLTDAQDMALIEGVMGLARHFGCEVIAEGVESAAHARALLRLGCQQGQGNGIAAALPAEDVPGWVAAFARSPWLMQLAASGGRSQGLA